MNIKELSSQDLLTQLDIRQLKMPYMPTKDNREDLGFSLAQLRTELEDRLKQLDEANARQSKFIQLASA